MDPTLAFSNQAPFDSRTYGYPRLVNLFAAIPWFDTNVVRTPTSDEKAILALLITPHDKEVSVHATV
ncbi:OST-HTH/LOTUS domain-containing protein [Pseudomonas oryzihabitans]|uniref:OST-HTH/LOTUS domain-containing protein n=1 Tax=Pseudomonas oryzihabitans TaxID=47885 RepID=UPI0035E44659